ncbi:MAG: hypothetical protein AAF670_07580 [Planctomycetota bacterium]
MNMVDRGAAFLAKAEGSDYLFQPSGFAGGLGERMLAGYAYLKATGDPTAKIVDRALAAAKLLVRNIGAGEKGGGVSKEVYSTAVAIMFLAELDAKQYKPELEILEKFVYEIQYRNGAFGYVGKKTGDISQTQYGVLAIWTLDHIGIPLDYERVKSCAGFLMRSQSREGGWCYQATDPGIGSQRIQQSGVNLEMTMAGGSSVLIAGDAMRLWGNQTSEKPMQWDGMPEAVKIYVEDQNVDRRKKATIPREPVLATLKACDTYVRNSKLEQHGHYPYYQYYTRERYESFREIAFGGSTKSPDWYNQGVEELRAEQDPERGCWGQAKRDQTGKVCSTAFSILFLIRSTKKSIAATSSGTLAGGRKLPSDTTKIRVDGTQIKGEPVTTAVTDLLSVLEEDDDGSLEGKTVPENATLSTNPTERRAQIDRFQRLLRGSQSWQARRVAARVLGQSDEIGVVPTLIFALSDPDSQVKIFARDGLRFISRKFEGFGMPRKPDYAQLRKAQSSWRQWYLSMDPGHVFLE